MATRPAIFKWRQTEPVCVLCAVCWYLRNSLSLRDVEELLEERGLPADDRTVWRWVQRYGPELEPRIRRHLKPAKRLFRGALSRPSHPQPRVINTDLAPPYGSAIPDIKREGILRRRCRHRPVQYLNNTLEQDHRAIKCRVNARQGFRQFQAAWGAIQGYEAMHMIRKCQVRWVSGDDVRRPGFKSRSPLLTCPAPSCAALTWRKHVGEIRCLSLYVVPSSLTA
jgi:IS6 family transposase